MNSMAPGAWWITSSNRGKTISYSNRFCPRFDMGEVDLDVPDFRVLHWIFNGDESPPVYGDLFYTGEGVFVYQDGRQAAA